MIALSLEMDDFPALDQAQDIITVGQGYDTISGRGGAEDRLVLPTSLMVSPRAADKALPEPGERIEKPVLQGVGLEDAAAAITGIPILGGFSTGVDGEGNANAWALKHHQFDFSVDGANGFDNPVPAFFGDYSTLFAVPGLPGKTGRR